MMLRGANGVIYQSGLRVGERGKPTRRLPGAAIYRAVVVNSYATDAGSADNKRGIEVLCDVILVRTRIPLLGVPVAANVGVNDAEPWFPKPTTATLSGNPLQFGMFDKRGNRLGEIPTSPEDMNGDAVLIEFVENDMEFPLIVGSLTHEQTRRKVIKGAGWDDTTADAQRGTPESEERYLRFAGVEVRINKEGDVLIDTVGATSDIENEEPSADHGQVRVRLKPGQKLIAASGGPTGGHIFEAYQDPDTKRVHIDTAAQIGFRNSAFCTFAPQPDGTAIYTLYSPYAFVAGVPTKAHSISVDPTPGNESISFVHGDGMSVTMFSNKIVIKNADGSAYAEIGPAGVILNGQTRILGSAIIGEDGAGGQFPAIIDPTGVGTLATQLSAAATALASAAGAATFGAAQPFLAAAGTALGLAAGGAVPAVFLKAK